MLRLSSVKITMIAALLGATLNAHALWDETIRIIGDEAIPPGASATLVLDTGESIEGEVKEDEDGQFLLFVLPEAGSATGTLTLQNPSQTPQNYSYDRPSSNTRIGLDLSASGTQILNVASAAASSRSVADSRWGFSVGLSGAHWMSDYFSSVIDDNTQELLPILDNVFMGTGSSVRGNADDSGCAYGVNVGVDYQIDMRTSVYSDFAYWKYSAADARIRGVTDVVGNEVVVLSSGESELDAFALSVGIKRALTASGLLSGYVSAGIMRTNLDDSFTTVAFANGDEFDRFGGSSSDHDLAEFAEIGLEYQLSGHWRINGGYRVTNETFNSEDIQAVRIRLNYDF